MTFNTDILETAVYTILFNIYNPYTCSISDALLNLALKLLYSRQSYNESHSELQTTLLTTISNSGQSIFSNQAID